MNMHLFRQSKKLLQTLVLLALTATTWACRPTEQRETAITPSPWPTPLRFAPGTSGSLDLRIAISRP